MSTDVTKLDPFERIVAMVEYLADAEIYVPDDDPSVVPCRKWRDHCTLHKTPWPCEKGKS